MSKVSANYFPRTISQYVPNMEFAADVIGDTHLAILGSPKALDADGIWDGVTVGTAGGDIHTSADYKSTFDGTSTSLTTTSGKIDATYGRCLTCTGNASTDQVVTIIGRDYLGQLMHENFTLSGTVVIHGNKAFKYVDSTSVTVGTGGSTLDVGWSDRLGLPYKTEALLGYTEDDVTFPHLPLDVQVNVPGVEYAAGTDVIVSSPLAGQVTGYQGVLTTAAAAADNVNTVFIGTTPVDVVGLTLTHVNPSAVGIAVSDQVTTDDDQPTSRVDLLEAMGISGDGGGTGAANYLITVEPLTFVTGDDTATQTATTEDTRGTILLTTPCDGTIEYEVWCKVNTSDLHGIEQFAG